MDEAEWLTCTDPERMLAGSALAALGNGTSWEDRERTARKRELFCAACCREVWQHFLNEPARRVVEFLEQNSERTFSEEYLDEMTIDIKTAAAHPELDYRQFEAEGLHPLTAANMAYDTAGGDVLTTIRYIVRGLSDDDPVGRPARLAAIMRDIVGNPFAPAAFDPAWRTSTVLGLAEAIYAGRAFGNLPVLADALEEAGCTAAGLLEHCRGPDAHVHGCWVLDLVLGRGEGAAA